ncbi:hypothetical protein EDWATA_03195 [Edwardsiella tarda ATCC 23685]|uniref:Uncharacterized protein n=1 Tax=Edwardsiella tarda ATCC 23685 TaxID=500638 RepID=D4F8U2_EDWTA|nr:hypothetical protein EDWATA_03195 [Edwardsiella tarda ATCC 23685]
MMIEASGMIVADAPAAGTSFSGNIRQPRLCGLHSPLALR